MNSLFKGLNPLSTETGCYHYTRQERLFFSQNDKLVEKKDTPIPELIENLDYMSLQTCFLVTYKLLVGHHDSFNIRPRARDVSPPPFKGILDFLVLPLIARKLWNWSFLMMDKGDNSFGIELAISAARTVAMMISTARIILGVAITLMLTPIIIGYYLMQKKPVESLDNYHMDDNVEYSGDQEQFLAPSSQCV